MDRGTDPFRPHGRGSRKGVCCPLEIQGKKVNILKMRTELNDWLSTIKEILDDPQPDAMDFLDAIKLNPMFQKSSSSPKGRNQDDASRLYCPRLAFQIHTFLGSHCIGAKR